MEPVWLIDCDNTLYPSGNGLFDEVNALIVEYMKREVGIPEGEVDGLRLKYWREYGLTMGGLVREHGVDAEHYLAYVHNVRIEKYLEPDPALAAALKSLPGKKAIFTNATAEHAERVLDCLSIREMVGEIFDIRYFDMVPKPKPHGYKKILDRFGVEQQRVWFVEDDKLNIETGNRLGMKTVLVGKKGQNGQRSIRTIHELPMVYSKSKLG